ncbi:GTPase family protein [Salinigranum marinum]|uniref:GTPase family protein n=1 Tax=Salinigranum marinum TaxID=1515595 RepID=UPI002989E213|nr:GTPase [Salinigranum marinum]
MAIDPEKFRGFTDQLSQIAEAAPMSDERSKNLMDTAIGTAISDMENLIDKSRAPVLYIMGRSGVGKSSLINALANKKVAEIDSVEPTTPKSTPYHISFGERYASWDIIDSRGLFESVSPDGDVPADTVELVKEDLKEYDPDVILHVMSPDQVRAGKEDFDTVKKLRAEFGPSLFPPVLYCLNKVDTHAAPNQWPPEEHPEVAGKIKRNLDFVAEVIGEESKEPFESTQPLYGYEFNSEEHIGVVPTFLLQEPYWNVRTLSWMLGSHLPESAQLQFFQAQKREELMRQFSRSTTNRFATLAGGIGGAPTPIADLPVLLGLQFMLIGLIGGFSCREIKAETATEYVSAMGGTAVTGFVARSVARTLFEFVPVAGAAVSASVAFTTTWALGRSAERYFFDDETVSPNSLRDQAKEALEARTEDD